MAPMLALAGVPGRAQGTKIQIYKDASCGCCSVWVTHLEQNGFAASVTNSPDMLAVKDSYGIPGQLRSCHTGVVNGYVVEGHVPAADIQRMLKEKPAVVGLAVPGMPIGSPGMEVPGMRPQPFDVIAFEKGGARRVFASHNR
ncbi:MAG: DUF411 domain-containing protein [Vicinamibacterales bacterium]